jgi:hypothetical protein
MYLVVSLGEKLNGWESLDLDILNLVGSGVHLGNHDLVIVGKVLSQLVPDGHKLFAVSCTTNDKSVNRKKNIGQKNTQADRDLRNMPYDIQLLFMFKNNAMQKDSLHI